jgi:hypothetical protein
MARIKGLASSATHADRVPVIDKFSGQEVDDEARTPVVKGRNILREKLNHHLDENM